MEPQRYPVSIRVLGVMQKDKKKMFMTSVLWSDDNDIVIYRTVEDFKKMHKQLKRAFPPTKKTERTVPKFQVAKKAKASQRTGSEKGLNYLKPLQTYCDKLLRSDAQVNQSVHLIQFLHPKDEELQPDYSRNGVVIMAPEEDAPRSKVQNQGGGSVTQPFATETYRCVAPFETKDTKNKPFKVAPDEKVDVLIKDKAGWWLVENEDKCLAWFPAPYLERLDDEPEDDCVDGLPERGMLYAVTKSYQATNDDEMTVSLGAVVEVLQKSENGWWLIRYKAKAGYIPSMYLKAQGSSTAHKQSRPQEPTSHSLLSPNSLAVQSQQLSRSQENLLPQRMPARPTTPKPTSPNRLQPGSKNLSKSVESLNRPQPAIPVRPIIKKAPVPPPPVKYIPKPVIKVESDIDDGRLSPEEDSDGEFTSDSDFSSDDLSSSSASTPISLSMSTDDYRLQHNRTPPPPSRYSLSPDSGLEGRLTPSASDSNIFKSANAAPRVPPRPKTKDILTRCTTVTRKNAKRAASPTPSPIQSR
ncbi:NADPH oxidase organizer 1a [Dunckerocampus dactyliophorus]|uniref:NADPH oxidase organizer 1a n=1 Tax=Dunckerocampus dactyliophorus TaxID=161453 RepID=UPI002404F674|nr:NADPH oxidase organizer 1a [Dunckerocampus dactyliophorus]